MIVYNQFPAEMSKNFKKGIANKVYLRYIVF